MSRITPELLDDVSESKERATLSDVLKFITGCSSVPSLSKNELRIEVRFISRLMPESNACFATVNLPLLNTSKDTFFTMFDKAILLSSNYFGQE